MIRLSRTAVGRFLLFVVAFSVVRLGTFPAVAQSRPASTDAAPPSLDPVRAAVERALPALADKGKWWIDEKHCVSCHRIGNMVWTFAAAERRGLAVPADLDAIQQWAVESSLACDAHGVPAATKNKEGIVQLLMADRLRPVLDADVAGSWRQMIADSQEADGCWGPGGQLPAQKRPVEETRLVSTLWMALALATPPSPQYAPIVERAVQAMEDYPAAPVSTEWFAAGLLLAKSLDDSAMRDAMHSRLLDLQHPDGGWGWLHADPSDALATGMALYALACVPPTAPHAHAIDRAQRFLITTQQPDGTWKVPGTKAKKKDRPQETSSYWGTAWAALGLITSMSDSTAPSP